MTAFIFSLTIRQIAGRQSTLLLLGLNLLPLLLAFVFHLSGPDVDREAWVAQNLMANLIVTTVLPLTALQLGTYVIGDEIEDGTVVYLLTKPLARWQLLLPKLAAAWLVTVLLIVPLASVSGLVVLRDLSSPDIVIGFGVAVLLGALAYATLFVLLSLVTNHALIAGLIYVFLWEGVITSLFAGTRYLSVRHYTLGIAGDVSGAGGSTLDAHVNGTTALVLMMAVVFIGAWYANLRLQRLELRERS